MVKVLVVDDSAIVRKRVKGMVSEVSTVETVSEAKDRLEAIDLLHKLKPDVMVVDIEMPGGNGIDLLVDVKKQRKPPLVIVLTNLSDPQYRKKCMDVGADFFFDKSIEFDKVAEVLRHLPAHPR